MHLLALVAMIAVIGVLVQIATSNRQPVLIPVRIKRPRR